MLPVMPKLTLDVEADHSCNWRCCYGCRCQSESRDDASDKGTPYLTPPTQKGSLTSSPAMDIITVAEAEPSDTSREVITDIAVRVLERTHRKRKLDPDPFITPER